MSFDEDRYVFKFLGSLGPGGTFGLFAEKLCQHFFNEAYEQHDPKQDKVDKVAKEIMDLRSDYVENLFEKKGEWNRAIEK